MFDHDLEALSAALTIAEVEKRKDPMKHFKRVTVGQDWLYGNIRDNEVYWHAGNMGAKTTSCCALDVAFLRGLKEIDGVEVPYILPNVTGVLGVPSYKIADGSSIPALLSLIGDHPHHITRSGGAVESIYVKHRQNMTDNYEDWSRLYVFPYEGPIPEALRLDFWHCDEPPPEQFLSALRFRKKAGRRLYGYIGATPILKKTWYPILRQYPEEKLKSVGGRMRIQTGTRDNKALTDADMLEIERAAAGDPLANAKLHGEHVDISGECPWSAALLDRWEARCREPERVPLLIQREQDTPDGRVLAPIRCWMEVFEHPKPTETYYMPADTGKGIKSSKHDPDCFHVYSRQTKRLVLRVNEYLGGYGLGQAMAAVARRYNNALADPAVTGGYGESVLGGLRAAGYTNVRHDTKESSPGVQRTTLGFTETQNLRARMIGALDRALVTDALIIESRAVIQCLRSCIVDENGKVLAAIGSHDEDLICAGRAAEVLQSKVDRDRFAGPPKPYLTFDKLMGGVFGKKKKRIGQTPESWQAPH